MSFIEVHASLRLSGQDFDPDELSRRLDPPPHSAHRGSDSRIEHRCRPLAPARQVQWSIDSGLEPEEPLERHISALVDFVQARADAFAEIVAEGLQADLFVSLFGEDQLGFSLSPELLAQIGSAGLRLEISVYC